MPAGRIYRGEFYNVENKYVKVDIIDHRVPELDISAIVPLELTDYPVRISSIDNDENSFTPIVAQQATIELFTTNLVSLADFKSGPDFGLECVVTYDTQIVHHGFISLRDNSVAYVSGATIITLTSSDGLGRMKGVPLTDFDGLNPQGVYQIGEVIAMCLKQTGLSLQFNVINSITLSSSPLEPFYQLANLDIKTFEAEIGETEDAYTVLEKILGYDSRLFQHEDKWWIIRVGDHVSSTASIQRYDVDGEWQFTIHDQNLSKRFGFYEQTWFADEQTNVSPSREIGRGRLTFDYENPKEIVCNIDFNRGISSEEIQYTEPEQTIDYIPECIGFYRSTNSTGTGLDQPPITGSIGVLRKKFVYGFEDESYLYSKIAGGFAHYFTFQEFYVDAGDVLEVGVDFKTNNGSEITNIYPVHVRIIGDDGFYYDWNYDQPTNVSYWLKKEITDTVFSDMFRVDLSDTDTSQFNSVKAESEKVPVSGRVVIRLYHGNVDYDLIFDNLTVSYIKKIINGSYAEVQGHYHQVSRGESGFSDYIEEQIYINDGPARVVKGSILLVNGDDYVLSTRWLADGQEMPYGWHQVYSVWNTARNAAVYFELTTQGFGDTIPHLHHRISVMDSSDYNNDRIFLLLTFEKDLYRCSMTGTMCEVFRSDIGKVFTDPYTFKYIT